LIAGADPLRFFGIGSGGSGVTVGALLEPGDVRGGLRRIGRGAPGDAARVSTTVGAEN